MKKILLLTLIGSFILSGCKYEFGGFSLKTKKGRISNDWKVDEVKLNGIDATDSLGNFYFTMTRDGDMIYTEILQGSGGDSLVVKEGIWEFNDRAENVIILFTDPSGVTEALLWEILRLQSDEFWVRETVDQDIIEYYFVVM